MNIELLTSKISRERLDFMLSKYETDGKTLEIGSCGNPSYVKFFSNRVGIDIKSGPGVDLLASVYEIPFKDEEFDVVLCLSVLEHLEDPRRAIAEMKRVLKKGGRIMVSVPFMFPIHDAPGDYWRFTKFGLRNLFSDWVIEEIKAETNTQETFAVLLQRLGYQTKMRLNKLSKLLLFSLAKLIEKIPNVIITVFGDIHKKIEEPEAFAGAFFMVARKKIS